MISDFLIAFVLIHFVGSWTRNEQKVVHEGLIMQEDKEQ
jgi:hypothetical protein